MYTTGPKSNDKSNNYFITIVFNWLFVVALTARSYHDYHLFLFWEWYIVDTLNLSRHT